MGTKNSPGRFDCFAKAEPDEPLFVLLARDPLAAQLVRLWATHPDSAHSAEKVTEALVCAEQMDAWRAKNRP